MPASYTYFISSIFNICTETSFSFFLKKGLGIEVLLDWELGGVEFGNMNFHWSISNEDYPPSNQNRKHETEKQMILIWNLLSKSHWAIYLYSIQSLYFMSKCSLLKVTYSKTVDNRLLALNLHTGKTGWANHYATISLRLFNDSLSLRQSSAI